MDSKQKQIAVGAAAVAVGACIIKKAMHLFSNEVWQFGYGSNMCKEYLERAKGMTVLECKPGVIKGFKFDFDKGPAIEYVEPYFATARKTNNDDDEIHGLCFKTSRADFAHMNMLEGNGAYDICYVPCRDYDGNQLGVHLFADDPADIVQQQEAKDRDPQWGRPSARYRNVVLTNAKKSGLAQEWIEKLENCSCYEPDEKTLKGREEALRDPLVVASETRLFTIETLKEHDGSNKDKPVYVSELGYVFDTVPMFSTMRGRDATMRAISHFHGKRLSDPKNDNGGIRPFPVLSTLTEDELNYVKMWSDHMRLRRRNGSTGRVVGVLKEFWEDNGVNFDVQESKANL